MGLRVTEGGFPWAKPLVYGSSEGLELLSGPMALPISVFRCLRSLVVGVYCMLSR